MACVRLVFLIFTSREEAEIDSPFAYSELEAR